MEFFVFNARQKDGRIYMHTNIINGKSYIGQTWYTMEDRWKQHVKNALNVKCKSYQCYFYRALRKYGNDVWEHQILEDGIISQDELNEKEIYYIELYGTYTNGYNSNFGGGNNSGFKHTKESKEKIRKAVKGRKHTEETKRKVSIANKGRKMSKEAREKNSIAHKGKNHPNYGKHLPKEIREKISKANKGKPPSIQTRQAVSKALKGTNNHNWKGYVKVLNKKTMELVGIYVCSMEVEKKVKSVSGGKLHYTHVNDVLKGNRKSHGGYIFQYATEEEYNNYIDSLSQVE